MYRPAAGTPDLPPASTPPMVASTPPIGADGATTLHMGAGRFVIRGTHLLQKPDGLGPEIRIRAVQRAEGTKHLIC